MTVWLGYHRISRVGGRVDTPVSEGEFERVVSAYAERNDFALELLPVEKDQTGSKLARPILTEALGRIETGEAAGIIVVRYNRLSRATASDTHLMIERVEAAGGQVRSVSEDFPDTPEGRWARAMAIGQSRMEWERSSAFIAQAKVGAVGAGIWPLPIVPFGYVCIRKRQGGDGKLHPDPGLAPTVIRGFEARAAGRSWRHVADVLGVGPSSAQKIIRNPVYLGEIRYVGTVNPAAHEPLVSRELWEAAQVAHPRPARRGNPPALLGGIARCAGCRYCLTRDVRPGGDHLYRCFPAKATGICRAPAIIGAKKLEEHVERIMLDHLGSLAVTAAQRRRELDEAEGRVRELEAEYEAFQLAVSAAGLGVEQAAAGLRTRVDAIEAARRDAARKRLTAEPVPAARELGEWWAELTVEERRHVLRSSLSVVWVLKGSGPAAERVRLIAPGFEPAGLPFPGRRQTVEVGPVEWLPHMPGEIGMTAAKDLR